MLQCSDYAAAIANNLPGWSGVQFSVGPRNCSLLQKWPDGLWDPPSLLFCGYQASFPGLKWPGHDINHSPPSVAKVKNDWSCTFNAHVFLHGRVRGGMVVKALRYKPAGRGFNSRWFHWNFSVT
jgi:hypothetical protein